MLETQRPNGSWGRWTGTPEESAYALQILLRTARPDERPGAVAASVGRGRRFLLRSLVDGIAVPPLWHDKELYAPALVVQAAILAAVAESGAATGQ